MKTPSLTLLSPLNTVHPKVVVTDAYASKYSPTTVAERGIWKHEPETNLRRCSSSSIHTPVTPKPSQIHVATNKSDIKFTGPAGDLTYGTLYTPETTITNTVRELQRSLKESKDYTTSLETKLEHQTSAQQTLKQELFELNIKYTSELARADNIGHEKSKIELELEDLTATLFEQANEMVAHEKRISQALEADNWRLCKDLSAALGRLAEETMQLTELKDKFSKQDTDWRQRRLPYPTSPTMSHRVEIEQKSNVNETDRSRIKIPLPSHLPDINVNSKPYQDFVHFLTHCKITPTKFQYSLPYIKRSQIEDVEPCLWFGEHAPVTCKKILQAIMRQSCFIEEYKSSIEIERSMASTWLSLRKEEENDRCQLCLSKSTVTFRFRLSEKCDWIYVDGACRQKLVAVCNYYAFIRNILGGLYTSQIPQSLYQENLMLKAKMFQARVGMKIHQSAETSVISTKK
ncbi:hypothetical protein INT44_006931 [Umbelopsis vinacea]|uniref:GDP/GTP exchange factor Sec2 N-terminal domain-containing protein n=1 Tax=Umbelopsis vinacea TaxID=44442 RepID=A0A8H7UAR8_9FUNG|nr:hypothetical protein INT44_006931 [Umbelopsis vinacea]